ncbi:MULTISPECIES: tetratricopeptide repeat protein [Asticcacaulis]|uniref:tetratricopeptide repeat protein n=1 Tax=Asticcacaulis TaxID=76890 RepID=UPI001AE77EC9|nr:MULTISPECIES: tetratricopeptide repeat protein [Asticcacaulis]MBP2158420.1 tetratricopeptide (TPR) repeat protein [Asticcacaulis solisilvae]MDR6799465.1 tetratricopeptide (TPR) repeat protein [Asticcacaulis sp. BE141]
MHSIDRLFGQANQARRDGRYAEARTSLDALILIARRQANDILWAQALTVKAQVECDDDHAVAAVPLYEEAVKLYRQTSDVLALASTLRHLGDTYQTCEEYDEASSRYEEALTIYQAVGDEVEDASPTPDNDLRQALAQCRNAWTYPDQAS